MRAIILAAGAARRLAPLTDRTNKCLLPVGGRSLLDRMLDGLAATGIAAATVVVGHCQDQVRAAAKAAGLTDVKVVAFSATHSALKLVIPLAARPAPAGRAGGPTRGR